MTQYTLVANDIQYVGFYLKDKDPTTGSITYHTLDTASSIVFLMIPYENTLDTISALMETVATPSNAMGYCRVLMTIPDEGDYYSAVRVYDGAEKLTWIGHTYKVTNEFGVL